LNRQSKKDSGRRSEEFIPIGSQIREVETMERHEGRDFILRVDDEGGVPAMA
jgi:hypothetical protein